MDRSILYVFLSCRAQKRLVNSQKYGVDLVRFTHAKNAAIHASTKRDDAIRYLSLHDNKVLTFNLKYYMRTHAVLIAG